MLRTVSLSIINESSSVHTAIGIHVCQTGFADCLLSSSQHNLYVLLCVRCWIPDDGQRDVRNMQSPNPK